MGGTTAYPISEGQLFLSDPWLSLTLSQYLVVADAGIGTVHISGGNLAVPATYVGQSAGSNGAVIFTSGTWDAMNGAIYVGGDDISAGGNGLLSIGTDATFNNLSTIKLWDDGALDLDGANVFAGSVELAGGTITGNGTLTSDISGTSGVEVQPGNHLVLGDASSATAFGITGDILIAGGTLELLDADVAELGANTVLDGGTLIAPNGVQIDGGDQIRGNGILYATISGGNAATGVVAQGVLNRAEPLAVATGATATVLSQGMANLGPHTYVGGVIEAPNGVFLQGGTMLIGGGAVNGRVAAAFGSTIQGFEGLSLGDANSYAGFFSDGELYTGANSVTINDKNEAVLGSLTELGDGASGGTLVAGTAVTTDAALHFLLEEGKNVVGRGTIEGNFKNQGHVIGDGTALAERVVFAAPWIVSGKGTFENSLVAGTFSPGESPSIVETTNAGYAGTVEIELGGLLPGDGDDCHDQINDAASVLLDAGAELSILPWNDFVPAIGDQFVIMTWQDGLAGQFADVTTDPWFADHGLRFGLAYDNPGRAGQLTLIAQAVPEPASVALVVAAIACAVFRRQVAS